MDIVCIRESCHAKSCQQLTTKDVVAMDYQVLSHLLQQQDGKKNSQMKSVAAQLCYKAAAADEMRSRKQSVVD